MVNRTGRGAGRKPMSPGLRSRCCEEVEQRLLSMILELRSLAAWPELPMNVKATLYLAADGLEARRERVVRHVAEEGL